MTETELAEAERIKAAVEAVVRTARPFAKPQDTDLQQFLALKGALSEYDQATAQASGRVSGDLSAAERDDHA